MRALKCPDCGSKRPTAVHGVYQVVYWGVFLVIAAWVLFQCAQVIQPN